jgi:hypothetical protein
MLSHFAAVPRGLPFHAAALFAFLSLGCPLMAQAPVAGSALRGAVLDPQDRAVAGAAVTLTEKAKGLVRQSRSDDSGSFLFPSIEPGAYDLRVLKDGFSPYEAGDLTIAVGQLAVLQIRLRLGDIVTATTVSASTQIETESNTLGSVVDARRVESLPLDGRNFLQLGLLAGGAVGISPANNNLTANVGLPARMIVLPGTLPYSVGYFLDGIPIRGSRDGELALNLSIAAIDQFKVQQGFLMPDQSANAGAVTVVSKSGSNRIHGEAFEFLRNGRLDARSFFAVEPEDLKQNQFGFALGGPLRKNRAWFHGFYEGLRQTSAFTSAGYTPTRAMFEGNFAGAPIFDPASYDPQAGTRRPFPAGMIPANRLNSVSKNLLTYYLPGSSLASVPNNLFGSPRNTLSGDQGGLRVDAALSERQQLFARVFRETSSVVNRRLQPLSGTIYDNRADLIMAAHQWTITPRMVNSLRAAFFRAVALGGNEAADRGPLLHAIGIPNTADAAGITQIDLLGYSSFGNSNGKLGNSDNTWRLVEEFSYAPSRHSFKFGFDLGLRRGWHLNANASALGRLRFSPVFTAQLIRNAAGQPVPQPNTGDAFADFLLGVPLTGQMTGLPEVEYRGTEFGPFAQDSWRVTPSLTLNYGIAWRLEAPPDPRGWARNAAHGFDRTTGLITYAALGQLDPQAVSTRFTNFAPRLGLAWQPRFLPQTVIRASAGIYYSQLPWLAFQLPLIISPPLGAGGAFVNAQTNPVPTYTLGTNIFPPPANAPLTSTYAAALPAGTQGAALDPALRPASVSQWSLSVQKSLGASDSFELSYVGSRARHLLYYTDISQCRPGSNLLCAAATKPWPRYDLMIWFDSTGNSSFEGLIARYDHRLSHGVDLRFEYAFAKALTDAWQSSQTSSNQIASCRRCDYGPATFDVRQRAVASVVWEAPFGRGRRYGANWSRVLDGAAGGWTVTGIVTFATGQPVYLSAPNQTSAGLGTPLPNRVCDGRSGALSDNLRGNGFLWFDPSCFSVPAVGFFGNSGRTVLGGPGINNWDLGLEKTFLLPRDSARLTLRGEAFNAWNHAQFEQPNGNAGAPALFGRVSATRPPRLIQLALKLRW